ncbi:octopamine receptor beta-2R-like [Stylophora pistillata]|uniref:octopamine receptor beta-2R-like n=1 Tax=Stylophora pistillata TaxID=50429 RepID=UPI000C04D9F1|nr:octopamine receptor beta-2R-like [Stylophora pistillata]
MEFYAKISLGVISVLAVAANFFVVCLVCLKRVPRTYTNWLTVSLAVSDILTGGILLHTLIIGSTHVVVDYLVSMILLWGVANICALTYDRYVAVIKPLQYTYRIPEIFEKTIIAVWLFPTIYSLLPLFWRKDRSKTIHLVYLICMEFIGVFIPYFFVTIAYARIFKEMKQSLALRKHLNCAMKQINERRKLSSDAHVAKLFFIMSMTFLISWVPIIYMTTAARIFGRLDIIPEVLPTISLYTVATASLVNPFVYALLKPDFRVVTRNMCRKSGRVGAMSMTPQQSYQDKTGGDTKSHEEPPQKLPSKPRADWLECGT